MLGEGFFNRSKIVLQKDFLMPCIQPWLTKLIVYCENVSRDDCSTTIGIKKVSRTKNAFVVRTYTEKFFPLFYAVREIKCQSFFYIFYLSSSISKLDSDSDKCL